MSLVRGHHWSVDGFGWAERPSEEPVRHAGTRLVEWFFPTRAGRPV
ncbi:MAG: hypothetical protein ACOYBY_15120 [Dermatophilaceae bacterium]